MSQLVPAPLKWLRKNELCWLSKGDITGLSFWDCLCIFSMLAHTVLGTIPMVAELDLPPIWSLPPKGQFSGKPRHNPMAKHSHLNKRIVEYVTVVCLHSCGYVIVWVRTRSSFVNICILKIILYLSNDENSLRWNIFDLWVKESKRVVLWNSWKVR